MVPAAELSVQTVSYFINGFIIIIYNIDAIVEI